MRPGASSRRPDISNHVAATHSLSSDDGKSRKVPVTSAHAVAMLQHNRAPVTAHKVRACNRSIRRRNHRLAYVRGNIHAHMERAFPVERIDAFAKRTCYLAFHR